MTYKGWSGTSYRGQMAYMGRGSMDYKGRPCSACMGDPSGTGPMGTACMCPMAYKGSGYKDP